MSLFNDESAKRDIDLRCFMVPHDRHNKKDTRKYGTIRERCSAFTKV